MANKSKHEKCCENCDNLIAIGQGDHICYECANDDKPCIMPISDYHPTEDYYMCGGSKWVD